MDLSRFGLDGVAFTPEEREAQLAELGSLCDRMADAYVACNEPRIAEDFRVMARNCRLLQAGGFAQADLNELVGEFPGGAWWLNLRAEAILEPWQDEILTLNQRACGVASDLRAVATHYSR